MDLDVSRKDLVFPRTSEFFGKPVFGIAGTGPRPDRKATARQALAGAALEGYERRRPHQLWGGQRSRVSLLRALLAAPQVLLLDEPFSRLDASLRRQMRDVVWATLRRQQLPALLVTHDEQDVPPGAQRIHLAGNGAAHA